MTLLRVLRTAGRAVGRNKLRSALTLLGIIIGVMAVIAVVGISTGARQMIEEQVSSLGSNVLMIFPGATTSSGARMGWGSASTLTGDDLKAISKECPAVAGISPSIRTIAQTVAGNTNWSTSIQGVSPDYAAVRNWPVETGAYFTEQDVRSANKVCLLGRTVADQLFADQDPVGATIRIKKLPFIVIGVLTKKGAGFGGQDQDDVIVAPYTTVQKKLMGTTYLGMVMASAVSADKIQEAQDQIATVLRVRHRIGPGQDDDFTIRTQTEFSDVAQATSQQMRILLMCVAAVSLVVGGIGIMNIMLVSVTERTREIGIRMAVGAKGRHILLQFLSEAVSLSALGGVAGIGLGMAVSRTLAVTIGWKTVVPMWAVGMAFAVSGTVGVFFGFYPAWKASRLDPIEALRYE
ncbi:MAG: multidrug ABC transporter substrate-binding protein [Candidatus Handelsmanbacteria bacterium RIFCSPLOWO2_12_FULL_64_10]|uniref:Multidrug ABC transporter substrate-binding protein n=1 Tax=Handelsmanbacteria sp. (strain RIFCSPLOWO2_12_FULL_64_10) TaxID=1817868 RepID=A0A1F6CR04_HANXR|nr:MAG: multidrug ABC transporter substrate-binding protein [Candidatus Handelsmanbacteria bacterium RIFCSPLOWO2_12_FULL_64_10]